MAKVVRQRVIPVAMPVLGEAEAAAARQTILSGWVTQGPRVAEFERAFARNVQSQHACAVSSCTTALHLALLAVGVKPGDAVVTVSHSFIATANSIRHSGAEPIFVDIEPDTFNMDPEDLERCLCEDFECWDTGLGYKTPARLMVGESPWIGRDHRVGRLGAILAVHQVGMPVDIGRILELARRFSVPVVEDAACAVGSEVRLEECSGWEKIGRPHGDIACFSLHPRKIITTGDGGMITTQDSDLDRFLRVMRHQGMSLSDVVRHSSRTVIFEDYEVTGYNYRLTDIQAAVGIEQLRRLPHIVERRREIAQTYFERLSTIDELILPQEPPFAYSNWQSYIVRLNESTPLKLVMQDMLDSGISTRRGIMCAHLEAPYKQAWLKGCLPKSERCRDTGLILPLYPGMEEEDLSRVVDTLKESIHKRTPTGGGRPFGRCQWPEG